MYVPPGHTHRCSDHAIRIKNGISIDRSRSLYIYKPIFICELLGVTAGRPDVPRAHVAKFYGRLRLKTTFEIIQIPDFLFHLKCNFGSLFKLHHLISHLASHYFNNVFDSFQVSCITLYSDEGPLKIYPKRAYSPYSCKFHQILKWCIHIFIRL